jgi:hypothetical protein
MILVGSPEVPRIRSQSLGAYLLLKLHKRGLKTEKLYIHTSVKSDDGCASLLQAIDSSDLVVLAFPDYTANPPSSVIAALELIAEHRGALRNPKKQRLVAVTDGSCPQKRRHDTVLAICRRFASETGLEWAGGLALGEGPLIRRRIFENAGRMVRNVKKALDLTANALAEDRPVPEEAANLMAKPMIPAWMYVWLAGRSLRAQAKEFGAQHKLYDRPQPKPTKRARMNPMVVLPKPVTPAALTELLIVKSLALARIASEAARTSALPQIPNSSSNKAKLQLDNQLQAGSKNFPLL